MDVSVELNNFLKAIDRNASLSNGYKYPYKPALVISIFKYFNNLNESIFNRDISLDNNEILKEYYDLITSDVDLYDQLIKQKSKKDFEIYLGFNDKLKKQLLTHIFEMPTTRLANHNKVWTFNKKDKIIRISINEIDLNQNINELQKYIFNYCCNVFKKCVPTYQSFSNSELDCFDYFIDSQIYEENNYKLTEIKIRQYQHTFAKKVKDRDKKCLICCEQTPELLQACHIKPYCDCKENIERYNIDNGITLCANHHILFDKHKFTFNSDWTIKISNHSNSSDMYMKIKEFEKCYELLKYSKTSNVNEFLEYRNKNYPV